MFYTYILESESGKRYYIGHTTDLETRLKEHNAGNCPHSAKLLPWRIKSYFAFETLELARNFERYLKSGSGHSFRKRHFE